MSNLDLIQAARMLTCSVTPAWAAAYDLGLLRYDEDAKIAIIAASVFGSGLLSFDVAGFGAPNKVAPGI